MIHRSLSHLTNATLANTFTGLVARDRTNTAELLLYLGELDERRLHEPAGADGRLHLTAIVLLARHLTPENADELLAAAAQAAEDLLSAPEAQADSPATRRIDAPAAPPPPAPVPSRPRVTPLAPERFAVHMTIDQETHNMLQYAQQLLSHQFPAPDVPTVFARALKALIVQLEKQKFAATDKPRAAKPRPSASTRHVPAAVKRAVRKRDGGQAELFSDRSS